MAKNPARATLRARRPDTVDPAAARELELFINNDFQLHRQQHEPIIKNLLRKMKKGTFDKEKAVILFRHLVDNGAKKYAIEFSTGVGDARIIFPGPTRNAVARSLRDSFVETAKSGGFSEMDLRIGR